MILVEPRKSGRQFLGDHFSEMIQSPEVVVAVAFDVGDPERRLQAEVLLERDRPEVREILAALKGDASAGPNRLDQTSIRNGAEDALAGLHAHSGVAGVEGPLEGPGIGVGLVDDHGCDAGQSFDCRVVFDLEGVASGQGLFDQRQSLDEGSGRCVPGEILKHPGKAAEIDALFIPVEGEDRVVVHVLRDHGGDRSQAWLILGTITADLDLESSETVSPDVLDQSLGESVFHPIVGIDIVFGQGIEHADGVPDREPIKSSGEHGGGPVAGLCDQASSLEAEEVAADALVERDFGQSAGGIDERSFHHGHAEAADQDVGIAVIAVADPLDPQDFGDVEHGMGTSGPGEFTGEVGGVFHAGGEGRRVFFGRSARILLEPLRDQQISGGADLAAAIRRLHFDLEFGKWDISQDLDPELERKSSLDRPLDESMFEDPEKHDPVSLSVRGWESTVTGGGTPNPHVGKKCRIRPLKRILCQLRSR